MAVTEFRQFEGCGHSLTKPITVVHVADGVLKWLLGHNL